MQPPASDNPSIEDFSFVELGVVLVRRGAVLAAVLVAGLGWTGWKLARTPAEYEARGVLRLGRTRAAADVKLPQKHQEMLLERADVLAARLREQYARGATAGRAPHLADGTMKEAWVSGVAFDKDADEIIAVTVRAPQPGTAENFARALLETICEEHRRQYAREEDLLAGRIAAARDALRQLEEPRFVVERQALEREIVQLQRDLAALQTVPTQVIRAAEPGGRVVPNVTLSLTVALVAAAVAGAAAALLWEYAVQVRARLATRKPLRDDGVSS